MAYSVARPIVISEIQDLLSAYAVEFAAKMVVIRAFRDYLERVQLIISRSTLRRTLLRAQQRKVGTSKRICASILSHLVIDTLRRSRQGVNRIRLTVVVLCLLVLSVFTICFFGIVDTAA